MTQIRQFSYNFLAHARPNGKRFRPYGAVGPVFQLIRLTDSKPGKNKVLALTVKDLGLIVDAYNFGTRPPLEGGGIFQFGLQYGGGFKYQVTPRFFVRTDFRETLSAQPNWWGKSLPHLAGIRSGSHHDHARATRCSGAVAATAVFRRGSGFPSEDRRA